MRRQYSIQGNGQSDQLQQALQLLIQVFQRHGLCVVVMDQALWLSEPVLSELLHQREMAERILKQFGFKLAECTEI